MPNFLIVQRGTEIGRKYDLNEDVTTLGRSADNDIELDDPYVSRYQAVVKKQGNDLVIIDLGSENPVMIRDTPLDPGDGYVLQHRDIVRIGQSVFSFINGSALQARPPAPAIDSYNKIPQMPVNQPSYNPAVSSNQSPYQPVGSTPVQSFASNSFSDQNSAPVAKPPVEDEGATMVGTNFNSLLGQSNSQSKDNQATSFIQEPSNPAVSSSSGSFRATDSSTSSTSGNAASLQPAPLSNTNQGANDNAVTTPPLTYNPYSDYKVNQFGEITGVSPALNVSQPQHDNEEDVSTTVVNTSGIDKGSEVPPAPEYPQPYSQYGQYDQYNQQANYNPSQYGQYGQQPQYGQYQQSTPYGQYDQSQYQPGQSQSQSGYGQGQQSQSQYGQYNPQAQYGQYNQPPQYGQVQSETNPAAPKKEENPADKPKEDYNLEDAPTTIIRIDKPKQ